VGSPKVGEFSELVSLSFEELRDHCARLNVRPRDLSPDAVNAGATRSGTVGEFESPVLGRALSLKPERDPDADPKTHEEWERFMKPDEVTINLGGGGKNGKRKSGRVSCDLLCSNWGGCVGVCSKKKGHIDERHFCTPCRSGKLETRGRKRRGDEVRVTVGFRVDPEAKTTFDESNLLLGDLVDLAARAMRVGVDPMSVLQQSMTAVDLTDE
jgi:hypothetical protein